MEIRPWSHMDRAELIPQIRDCLIFNSLEGADLTPSERNIMALLKLGMDFAYKGDPTFVAVRDERIVGHTLWGQAVGAFELRDNPCFGFETYVEPAYRLQNIASTLRAAAIECARARGYKRVIGTAFHSGGLVSGMKNGFIPRGIQCEVTL